MIIEAIKRHPMIAAGGVAVVVLLATRSSSSNGVPSDSVLTASINANKEIAIAQIEAGSKNKATQADLITHRIQSDNEKVLGLAITNNSRVVDLSKVSAGKATSLANTRADVAKTKLTTDLGILESKNILNASKYSEDTKRILGHLEQALGIKGLEYAKEGTMAEINGRTKIAEIGAQLQREQWAWDAPQRWHEADVQAEANRLNLMGIFDTNATNVTLMKKQMGAQNLATGLGFVSDINQSNNQTAASLGQSFFGMIGNVFGGMGGMLMGGT